MDLTDRAHRIRKAMEEHVYNDCMAKGRLDVLDAIRDGGYETRSDGPMLVSMWVAGECVARFRLHGPELPPERLN